jgi:hypothetical protein
VVRMRSGSNKPPPLPPPLPPATAPPPVTNQTSGQEP